MVNNYKVDILAFGAHPDDVECAASGVVLKHIALGKKVAIIDMTAGEMGTHGTPEIRKQEAEKASRILGVSYREGLGIADGGIENTEVNRIKVMEMIRKYQPEVILCNAIYDKHPDHANASNLVEAANFLSGLTNKKTFLNKELQLKWRAPLVLHYVQDYYVKPDIVIDITAYMETKLAAILAYNSQFVTAHNKAPGEILGLLDQIKSTNTIFGRPINARYAEGFTVSRYLGVTSFDSLI